MRMHRIVAALLWTLAAAAAFVVCTVWIADAQRGAVGAWVILPFFWSAAVLAVAGRTAPALTRLVSEVVRRLDEAGSRT